MATVRISDYELDRGVGLVETLTDEQKALLQSKVEPQTVTKVVESPKKDDPAATEGAVTK